MKFCFWLIIVLAFTGMPASAETSGPPRHDKPITDRDLTDEQVRSVSNSEKLGFAIFSHDQAAWGSTDYLRERGISDKRVKGWITEDDGDATRVLWIGDFDGELKLVYEMRMVGKQVVDGSFTTHVDGKALKPRQLAAFRARLTAGGSAFEGCEGTYNSVVLPSAPGEPDGYDVYMLIALPDWGKVMVGGNVLVHVDATGTNVLGTKYFTKSCLVLSTEAQEGQRPVALSVSDIMSETPTPIHVFLNLQHKLPFFVLTTLNGIVWTVEEGRIKPFKQLEKPAP